MAACWEGVISNIRDFRMFDWKSGDVSLKWKPQQKLITVENSALLTFL